MFNFQYSSRAALTYRLIQIINKIIRIFNANTQTNQ